MANDCLLTKLKGVVDNDNLKIYNTILTRENTSGNVLTFLYNASNPVKIEVIGDGTLVNVDGTVDYGKSREGTNIFAKYSGNGKIKISNKYDITLLHITSSTEKDLIDAEDLVFVNITELELTNIKLDVNKLNITTLSNFLFTGSNVNGNIVNLLNKNDSLTSVKFNNTNVVGDFYNIKNTIAEAITTLYMYNSKISGDISAFGRFVNLNQMSFSATDISGSVESFVQAARAAGRTSFANSEQKNWYFNNAITFNGNAVGGGGKNDFSWTATTITLGGVTITA